MCSTASSTSSMAAISSGAAKSWRERDRRKSGTTSRSRIVEGFNVLPAEVMARSSKALAVCSPRNWVMRQTVTGSRQTASVHTGGRRSIASGDPVAMSCRAEVSCLVMVFFLLEHDECCAGAGSRSLLREEMSAMAAFGEGGDWPSPTLCWNVTTGCRASSCGPGRVRARGFSQTFHFGRELFHAAVQCLDAH